ncbi:MAG: hypothetical protein LEGION0398_MBIBDBAK_00194 [Legionellaceae bacterium]
MSEKSTSLSKFKDKKIALLIQVKAAHKRL